MFDQAATLRKMVKKRENQDGQPEQSEQHQEQQTRVIAIASGKGGVGKTNITVNLGLALQKLGEKVLLIDADLGMANIDILLGLTSRYNLTHILKGECEFNDALLTGPEGLDILPGTSGVEDLISISHNEVVRLLKASSQMEEQYDIILIDVGAGIHQSIINFIMGADEAMIVLTPEPTAIMDAYSLIKYLARKKFTSQIGLLINQVDSKEEADQITARMKKTVKKYLEVDIELLGYLPYDSHLQRSVKKQNAVLSLFPNSKVGQAFNENAEKLIDRKSKTTSKGVKGFFYRIVGMFKRD